MAYTDLWRCKKCETLPEILMRGKNFAVKCESCRSEETDVFGDNIDEVVAEWNWRNDPAPHTLAQRLAHRLGWRKKS